MFPLLSNILPYSIVKDSPYSSLVRTFCFTKGVSPHKASMSLQPSKVAASGDEVAFAVLPVGDGFEAMPYLLSLHRRTRYI